MQLLHCPITYRLYRETELKQKKTKKKYTLRFKLNVLKFELETGTSYKETAILWKEAHKV
ncbi:hypothetical protein B8A39_08305 [Dolosigranulum pigrum]|nr:hypothetical protein B8A39_08305 [Dolosigranulum pigrum]